MGDELGVARRGTGADPAVGDALPALARPAVLGVHLLHRLQGELGRVQGHGPGSLRAAEVRAGHLRQPARPQAGRHLPDEHGVLQLLRRPHDDQLALRSALRWPAPRGRDQADAARDGSGPLGPGGHGGNHAPSGPHAPPGDRQRQPLPGRWRRAELRGQRTDPARGTVPRVVDPAGRRRRRRGGRRRAARVPPPGGPRAQDQPARGRR